MLHIDCCFSSVILHILTVLGVVWHSFINYIFQGIQTTNIDMNRNKTSQGNEGKKVIINFNSKRGDATFSSSTLVCIYAFQHHDVGVDLVHVLIGSISLSGNAFL